MKISSEMIEFIENVVKTGQSVNIDNVIIEQNMVRALDDARTVVLYQTDDVPELPFGSIGLTRIGDFLARLETAKTQDNFSLDMVVDDNDEYVRSVTMKATGTKIDYRCANPATIQAPKQINDNLVYRVQLNAEAVSLLQKGHSAMSSDIVTFSWDEENGASFSLSDVNSDEFIHTFTKDVDMLEDDVPENFKHNYPVKTLLALFKQNPDGQFEIGEKGMLAITVNGLNIYVLPKV